MSAKKNYKKPVKKAPAPQPKVELEQQAAPVPLNIILPIAVALITFICYSFTLHNQFLDWDDWIYVQKDPYITSFSWENLKMMLFHNITKNYYHPITMLSLAFNYHFAKLDPQFYYFTNVLIHVLNTVLIFILIKTLLEEMSTRYGYGRIKGIPWVAALCALFHGVHPMHVESVAWMCERKDILYSFFYFLGLIMYLRYVKEQNLKWMGIVVLFYFCSLMSKPMAVSFPFTLFAFDIILKRDRETSEPLPVFAPFAAMAKPFVKILGWLKPLKEEARVNAVAKVVGEKAPFFIISLAGGILVYFTAKESGSIAFLNGFTFLHKLTVPFYSFMMYAVKAFVPYHLCSYYPYPAVTTSGAIPLIFYICPLIVAAMVGIPLYLSYKTSENAFRVVLFGIGFYLANVLFILQFLSAGVAIMCERYSYMAYGGIFFMVAYFINRLIQNKPEYKVPVIAAVAIFVGMLAYVCKGRTTVWHNSESLWHDVIRKYPRQWLVPYMNLAQYYIDSNKMDSAFVYYNDLAQLNSKEPLTYRNLANLYAMRKNYDKSLECYNQAIKLDTSKYVGDTYLDRAVTYSIMGKLDLALEDYNRAYKLDSNSEKLLANRAYALMSLGKYDLSVQDYSHLIRINANEPSYYFRRGQAELNKGSTNEAITDFNKSLSMQANNGECLYDMSLAYNNLKDYSNALGFANRAKQAGFQVPDTYMSDLQKNAGNKK